MTRLLTQTLFFCHKNSFKLSVKVTNLHVRLHCVLIIDQGRSDFRVAFTMSLCTLKRKRTLVKFAIRSHMDLKLGIQALRSYLKLTCEYGRHILSNTNVSPVKDNGKNYMKVRAPWGSSSFA